MNNDNNHFISMDVLSWESKFMKYSIRYALLIFFTLQSCSHFNKARIPTSEISDENFIQQVKEFPQVSLDELTLGKQQTQDHLISIKEIVTHPDFKIKIKQVNYTPLSNDPNIPPKKMYKVINIPFLMKKNDFDFIARGAKQRALALKRFLYDIFSGQNNIIKDGVITLDVVKRAFNRQFPSKKYKLF